MLSSCGYRSAYFESQPTLSIPYVQGDEKGLLTAALVSELNRKGLYEYVTSHSELKLKVAIVDGCGEEVIGFRYNRTEKKGHVQPNLMAAENRYYIAAEVTLFRTNEDQPLLGPVVVTACAEYDYIDVNSLQALAFTNAQGKREKVIDLSQGQLDSIEGAHDNARSSIYDALAKKIASLIERACIRPLA